MPQSRIQPSKHNVTHIRILVNVNRPLCFLYHQHLLSIYAMNYRFLKKGLQSSAFLAQVLLVL